MAARLSVATATKKPLQRKATVTKNPRKTMLSPRPAPLMNADFTSQQSLEESADVSNDLERRRSESVTEQLDQMPIQEPKVIFSGGPVNHQRAKTQ